MNGIQLRQAVWFLLQSHNYQSTSFWNVYGVAIVFALINIIVPNIIERVTALELYSSAKTTIIVRSVRVFVLRILNIYAVMYGLYKGNRLSSQQLPFPITDPATCAGTIIGQQFYKLIIVDTILQLVARFGMSYFKYRRCVRHPLCAMLMVSGWGGGLSWI